jgi:catalase-peroxidase
MGPSRATSARGFREPQLWQDPVPAVDHDLVGEADVAALKEKILDSGLSVSQLVATAWASASSFRGTDMRGGANGARIRLAPQKDWEVKEPAELARCSRTLEESSRTSTAQSGGTGLARRPDRLGGCAAVEQAAKNAGRRHRPVRPGRTDASQEQTDGGVSRCSNPPTVPQLPRAPERSCRRRPLSTGRTC